MSVIQRLLGRDPQPWGVGPPLFDVLAAGIPDPDCVLPDADRQERFTLSGLDRYALVQEIRNALSNSPVEPPSPTVATVETALVAVLADPGHRPGFYRLVRRRLPPSTMISLYEGLRDGRFGPAGRVRDEGRWLLHTAPHREAVWFATAMLTACGTADDVDDLAVLMQHSAFQIGAIRAAAACIGNPMDAWRSLHNRAGFLGRLNLIKLLIEHAANRPDVRGWLLRHGAGECDMPALVARDCAVAGGLAAALAADIVDGTLIDGARSLIETMLEQEQSNDGISDSRLRDYPDAVDAIERLLHHLAGRTDSLSRLATVVAIKDWLHGLQAAGDDAAPEPQPPITPLAQPDADGPDTAEADMAGPEQADLFGWAAPPDLPPPADDPAATPPSVNPRLGHGPWAQRGLTPERRRRMVVACERLIGQPHWPAEIRRTHADGDPEASRLAWRLADRYRLDLWAVTFRRLEQDPVNPDLYRDLCDTRQARRVQAVLTVAERALPLDRIGPVAASNDSGDAPDAGTGRQGGTGTVAPADRDAAGSCLALLLRAMDRHRLLSAPLVKAALYSPATRHRLAAVRVLSRHPWWQWGDDVQDALRHCLACEPDDTIRDTIYRAAMPGEDRGTRIDPRSLHGAGPFGLIQPVANGRRRWMRMFGRAPAGKSGC